jgi:hypothetical protein
MTIRLRRRLLDLSSLDLNVRRGRMKSSILARSVQDDFRLVLFAHFFTTVHEWGSVELCM